MHAAALSNFIYGSGDRTRADLESRGSLKYRGFQVVCHQNYEIFTHAHCIPSNFEINFCFSIVMLLAWQVHALLTTCRTVQSITSNLFILYCYIKDIIYTMLVYAMHMGKIFCNSGDKQPEILCIEEYIDCCF